MYGRGVLRAIDYQTGKIRWSHDLGDGAGGAGVLTTATGLAFTGDTAGNALALRTSDGTTLWHSGIGRVGNAPITYELDGRQYVLLGGGSALYAWALPETAMTFKAIAIGFLMLATACSRTPANHPLRDRLPCLRTLCPRTHPHSPT